jgi:hypothetical protein
VIFNLVCVSTSIYKGIAVVTNLIFMNCKKSNTVLTGNGILYTGFMK